MTDPNGTVEIKADFTMEIAEVLVLENAERAKEALLIADYRNGPTIQGHLVFSRGVSDPTDMKIRYFNVGILDIGKSR